MWSIKKDEKNVFKETAPATLKSFTDSCVHAWQTVLCQLWISYPDKVCGTDFAVRNLWFWGEIFALGETGNNPSCISLYWLSHPGINSCIMETALKDIHRTAFGDYQCLEGHSRNTIDGSITHCCLSKIYCAPKTCKWMRHLWSDEDFESKVYALNTEKAVPFEVSGRAHSGHGWGRIRCQKYFCFWFSTTELFQIRTAFFHCLNSSVASNSHYIPVQWQCIVATLRER